MEWKCRSDGHNQEGAPIREKGPAKKSSSTPTSSCENGPVTMASHVTSDQPIIQTAMIRMATARTVWGDMDATPPAMNHT
jgi:hypothetical protein